MTSRPVFVFFGQCWVHTVLGSFESGHPPFHGSWYDRSVSRKNITLKIYLLKMLF